MEEKKVEKKGEDEVTVEALMKIPKVKKAIEQGIMPFNPIEMAKDSEALIKMGKDAGRVYGGSLWSIKTAFVRDDLPFDVRVAKAGKGAVSIISMILSAMDEFKRYQWLEDSVLLEKAKGKNTYEKRESDDDYLEWLKSEVKRVKAKKKQSEKKLYQ